MPFYIDIIYEGFKLRKFYFLLFLTIIYNPIFSQNNFEVRGHKWDATINSIIQKDGRPNDIEIWSNKPWYKTLFYDNVLVAGHNLNLQYTLFDDKLLIVHYTISERGNYLNKYRTIYMDIRGKLIDIYGEPNNNWNSLIDGLIPSSIPKILTPSEVTQRINESYSIEEENKNIGFTNETSWDINRTKIELKIDYYTSNRWTIIINYTSPKYWDYFNESIEREKQNRGSTDGL